MYVLYWVKELSGLMFSLHQAQFLVLFWLAHINKTPIIYSPKKAALSSEFLKHTVGMPFIPDFTPILETPFLKLHQKLDLYFRIYVL